MATRPKLRIRPFWIPLILGAGIAVLTAVSGILGAVAPEADHSRIQREVFDNIPSAMRAIFYATLPVVFVAIAWLFAQRMQNWERGQPDDRRLTGTNAKRRFGDFRAGVYMQTLLRDPAAGVMHSLIYFPFLILFAITTVDEINHQLPVSMKFLHGGVYEGYSLIGDVAGVLFLVGIFWAIIRRYIQRPYRLRLKTRPEDGVILGTFAVIGITGFLTEGLRIALTGRPSFEKWSIIGWPLSSLFDGASNLSTWHQVLWVTHFLGFVTFLLILPVTK